MKDTNKRIHLPKRQLCILLLHTLLSILFLIGCLRYSVFESFQPDRMDIKASHADDLDQLYRQRGHFVESTAPVLYYSGYDYVIGSKVKGHYYYSLENERCCIFLISTDYIDNSETVPDTLENVSIHARLLKHDSNMRPLLEYIADDLQWNYNSLTKVTEKYIVSQVDYNPSFNQRFLVITILCLISNLILFIIYILKFRKNPKTHKNRTDKNKISTGKAV